LNNLKDDHHFTINAKRAAFCTNSLIANLFPEDFGEFVPGRGQIILTKPIKNLKLKGTFHMDDGFYYFRSIHDRILIGGGRNLDF